MPRSLWATYGPAMTIPTVARDPGDKRPAPEGAEGIYDRRVRNALDEYRAFTRAAYARALDAETDEAA